MRLIDADKIRYRDMSDGQVNGGVWYTFIEDIQKQPIVDAVPVIRCKDCKYRDDLQFSPVTIHLCARFNKFSTHTIDDLERFCSWGERKEE